MPILYNPKTSQLAKLAEGTNLRFIEDVRREAAEQRKKKEHKEQEGGGAGMEETMYYTAADVRKMLGVSRGKAYQLIKELNEELEQRGYIVLAGKVPMKLFAEKVYGMAGSN